MTRKHFEGIAQAINDEIRPYDSRAIQSTVYNIIDNIADYCQSQNLNFDRERFLEACGIEDEKREQYNHVNRNNEPN